ncbi:hypothetical protein FGB62_22g19 [Gracilaria domingensis]|nr:hypothetical protein FGB62_22g19 [Gracilaria domingensis]
MGACFSSSAEVKLTTPKNQTAPFTMSIAFPFCAPYSLQVDPSEKLGSVRKRVVAEMERRERMGEDFARVEGNLVTTDEDTMERKQLADNMTIAQAGIKPKQYLWFQDEEENTRVQDLLLRSSRLTENTSHNSRGVKQGMALIKEEDEAVAGY